MKAIAFIKSDIVDRNDPLWRTCEEQENSIRNYCMERNIELLQVFTDSGRRSGCRGIEIYLSMQLQRVDFLIVNSLDMLYQRFNHIAEQLISFNIRYNLRVVCLFDQFVKKIVKGVNELCVDDIKKKQVAELSLQYLLRFRAKDLKFSIKDLADYHMINRKYLLEPFIDYLNPFYIEGLPDNGLIHFKNDRFLHMSLIEAALIMLGSHYVVIYNLSVNGEYEHIKTIESFKIISSVIKPVTQYTFLVQELFVGFSNEFWDYMMTYT